MRYYRSVIQSFRDENTKQIAEGKFVRRLAQDMQKVAARKLAQLEAATRLEDLSALPGNRLEALKGDRAGQHSIRINDQWRVCFVWAATGPAQVEIVDYH